MRGEGNKLFNENSIFAQRRKESGKESGNGCILPIVTFKDFVSYRAVANSAIAKWQFISA